MTQACFTPPVVKPGDKVGIISTARKITPQEVHPAMEAFKRWGLTPVKGKNLHARHHQFAGTDRQRANDLQEMLDDPQIKAVICARGGYGTARIIDLIDFSSFKNNPKWIAGYSDVTALHSHIHTHLKVETLHAPMPFNFPSDGKETQSIKALKQVLFNGSIQYSLPNLEVAGKPLNKPLTGILTGGNLSVLYSLIGSPSDIHTEGKILFLEDLDEYLYHVDRMMLNLRRSGKMQGIKALLVGWMNDMNDNPVPFGKNAREIILENTCHLPFPVIFGIPAGHLEPNLTLILGRKIRIENKELDFGLYC